MPLNPRYKSNKAYTLVGMAIALAVAGLIIGGAVGYYKIYKQNASIEKTVNNTDRIMKAVSNFLVQNGRYPCPAPINIATDNPTYGLESGCSSILVGALGTLDATQRLWVEQSISASNPLVVRGAVPFRSLNLPEFLSLDAYNSRFEYAVTLALTNKTTYTNNGGGISIHDASGNSLLPTADTADFLVLSHGKDKVGGYNKEGAQLRACGMVELDKENCNTATDSRSIYISSSMADLGPGDADNFDDYVGFYSVPDKPLWTADVATGYHIYYGDEDSNTPTVVIGKNIGDAFDSNMKLDVNGSIKATGNIYADYICDDSKNERDSSSNSSYCLSADQLNTGFSCPTGYVVSIDGYAVSPAAANSSLNTYGIRLNCGTAINFTCPKGQVMIGFDVSKNIKCDYPPHPTIVYNADTSCPAQDVRVCSNLTGGAEYINLVAAPNGTISNVATALVGSAYNAKYQCKDREWVFTGSTGTCEETAANICNFTGPPAGASTSDPLYSPWAFYNRIIGSGGGGKDSWSGIWRTVELQTCKDKFFDLKTAATPDDIQCNDNGGLAYGAVEDYVEACPAGNIGNISQTKTWGCTSTTAGAWTIGTPVSNCIAQTLATPLTCPEGLVVSGSTCTTTGGIITDSPANTTAAGFAVTAGTGIKTFTISGAFNSPTIGSTIIIKDATSNSLYGTVVSFDSTAKTIDVNVTIPHGDATTLAKTWNLYYKTATTDLPKTIRVRMVSCPADPAQFATLTEVRSFASGIWGDWVKSGISGCYGVGEWVVESMPIMSLLDTSNSPPTASVTPVGGYDFTVTSGMPYFTGQPIYFVSRGKRSHVIYTSVYSYSGTSLTVNPPAIGDVNGTPTLRADWDIYVGDSYYNDKGSIRQVGDICPIIGVKRSCYADAGEGRYYQFKDCVCK